MRYLVQELRDFSSPALKLKIKIELMFVTVVKFCRNFGLCDYLGHAYSSIKLIRFRTLHTFFYKNQVYENRRGSNLQKLRIS